MYRIKGNKFTHNGHEFMINGVNIGGMEGGDAVVLGLYANRTIANMLDDVKSLGFNALRLPIASKTIKDVPVPDGVMGVWQGSANEYMRGWTSMRILDHFIEECEKRGIRYIFDSHNKNPDGHPDGMVPHLWYDERITERQWIDDMVTLAVRYRDKPGFIGIDTKNEPSIKKAVWGGGGPNDWKRANEEAYKAISAVNPNVIVVIEPLSLDAGKGFELIERDPPAIPKDRVAYSPHVYFHDVWSGPGWAGEGLMDSDFPSGMPKIWDRMFGNFSKNNAVVVGEFGGKARFGSKDLTAQEAFTDYLVTNKISSLYWILQETSWDTGGIYESDGLFKNVNKTKMSFLSKLKNDRVLFTDATMKQATVLTSVSEVTVPSTMPSGIDSRLPVGSFVRFFTGEGPKGVVQKVTATNATVAFPPYEVRVVPLAYLIKA